MELPLRPDQEAHLIELCRQMGRRPEDFVREAVLTFMEDYEDGSDAERAIGDVTQTYSQEEMEQRFGLEDRVPQPLSKTA